MHCRLSVVMVACALCNPHAFYPFTHSKKYRLNLKECTVGMAVAPLVFLLDLDGTLIGKVSAAVCEYDVARMAGRKELRAFRESLVSRLRYGIIRPHVHAFCKQVAASGGRIQLFVYTASEASWAAFIVPCVEAALGFKFNRPLFTRSQCIGPENKKSIAKVRPAIFARLRKPFGLAHARELEGRIALVDNTADVLADPAEPLVLCPTYAYTYTYDVLGRVDIDTLHRRFARMVPCLTRAGLFPPVARPPASYQEFAALYYGRIAAVLSETLAANASALANDHFWARFMHLVARTRTLEADAVGAIVRRMQSK
jgi:hypothetical protein